MAGHKQIILNHSLSLLHIIKTDKMKSTTLILALVITFSASLFAQEGKTLPSVEVKTLDGKRVDIQQYAQDGRITILSFWATWCSPCKKELDAVADLYQEWQETYDLEFVAITIDTQRDLAKVKPMVSSKAWPFTFLSDINQQLLNALNFQTIPQTFVIDKAGNIAYSHNGYTPGDEYELEKKLMELAETE